MIDFDHAIQSPINNSQTEIGELSLGYGDANSRVHAVLQSDGTRAAATNGLKADAVLDTIYSGSKAVLRLIHDTLMQEVDRAGEFEILPKQGYVSFRRKRQFDLIGLSINTRVEVDLNIKTIDPDPRLIEQAKGSMCNFIVRHSDADQVDAVKLSWFRSAYERVG